MAANASDSREVGRRGDATADPWSLPEGALDLRPWFQSISDVEGTLNWRDFWGNDHPVELDVGCGRGLFVFNASAAHPEINYLGLELDFTEGRRGAKRLWRIQRPNARIIGGDASTMLRWHLPSESVQAVHVYFPDPWWKPRHRRRRIFTDEFVELCRNVLQPGGLLHSWTDVGEYFEVIQALMDHHPGFETQPPPDEHQPRHEDDYHTGFERKKRKEGCVIHRGLWRKKS